MTVNRADLQRRTADECTDVQVLQTTVYILCRCSRLLDTKNNLDLLDPQAGFAPRLRQLREQQCVLNSKLNSQSFSFISRLSDIQEKGKLEKWNPPARALLSTNPYNPTSALAQATMAASRTLSELIVVREWLYDAAPPRPDASTEYWHFAKHRVAQGRGTGNGEHGSRGGERRA
jgi:nuclear pore complex protein Nup107